MLAWTIYISFLGAAAVMAVPRENARPARWIALLCALAGFGITLAAAMQYRAGELMTVADARWIPQLGIEYHLAIDGISLTLLLLTGIAAIAGILFSWNIERRVQEFFALYLALIGGVYGVFLSFDLFLLFIFYEIAIIPKYFLIAIWGSTRREYAAMKLALYSFVGSAMVLAGMIAAFVTAGATTMNLAELARYPFPVHFQMWAFPLVFVGFAILAGLWPFHTWAPTGHVAAPTAASMLLAGVVMKLGAYGCLRVAMMLFPQGLDPWGFHVLGFGSWRDVFALMALIGILYGATVALVQKDFKFVIGYSSVSHMGFVLLGLMTLNLIGLDGAVLQMFSHGVIAGLLFAVVGRMIYDRTHTRNLNELETMRLSRSLPFAAVTFIVAAMASIGLPGFSGFIAELQILIGAWRAFPAFAMLAGVGILVGIAFTWRALQKAFFGEAAPAAEAHPLPPVTLPEKLGALLLMTATLVIGLYPRLLVDLILPSLNSPLFAGLHKAVWR
ncbi:complex I subunit 4 family protein [Paracidobacterium acidisoli]|uniref:NADH-quinone oxidoreductase subunit M n=1 Tax=Paracidobacterium acidisoli TaxID=2303751 RepID=A0A372IU06_9BACT|nr:NADH-quinone oxidoreductase subunit M [Paracidobacterium acidisoli]MBT9329870.1 NADH-quinone oxidoreductase subunit M [Paracidobacterium acidisoli]